MMTESDIMQEWKKCRKRPVEVEYREPREPFEQINTMEGTLFAYPGVDYVIKGTEGELYPIKIAIFKKTYETEYAVPPEDKDDE